MKVVVPSSDWDFRSGLDALDVLDFLRSSIFPLAATLHNMVVEVVALAEVGQRFQIIGREFYVFDGKVVDVVLGTFDESQRLLDVNDGLNTDAHPKASVVEFLHEIEPFLYGGGVTLELTDKLLATTHNRDREGVDGGVENIPIFLREASVFCGEIDRIVVFLGEFDKFEGGVQFKFDWLKPITHSATM